MLIETALRFSPEMLQRPTRRGTDVVTTLEHFAIITYAVAPDALSRHLHPRFEPVCVRTSVGGLQAMVSAVPFRDTDFHFTGFRYIRFAFGQTNYRAYVQDRETGEMCAWFFGTVLDSPTVSIPRWLWKLPWHSGSIDFRCQPEGTRYRRYEMRTESAWAAAAVDLEDTGEDVCHLDGFPDVETGLVVLSHPMTGYYFRRDGTLGSYRIWHDRLCPHVGRCHAARFDLLDRLGLVPFAAQQYPHSVLIQRQTEFTIFLPPRKVSPASSYGHEGQCQGVEKEKRA